MARVKGIVSAGLASAKDFTKESSSADVLDNRIKMRAGRLERLEAGGVPSDLLGSLGAGAMAGWVFGPIGGLITGGIAALMAKNRRDGIAAYAMQDAEATEQTLAKGFATLDSLAERYEGNDEALAEIAMYREQAEQYAAGVNSPDPAKRAQALVSFGSITGTLDTELEEINARQLEAEARDRAQFEQEVGQFNTLQDDLRSLSGDYLGKRNAWNTINQLGKEQNIANDTALVYNILKMYDPNSTVLPGEQAQITNAASVPDAIRAQYNKLITGKGTLDPDVRADFLRQADDLYQASFEQQKEIEAQYIEKGRATGLRPELLTAMPFTTAQDAQSFAERPIETRAAPMGSPTAAAAQGGSQAGTGPVEVEPSQFARGASNLMTEGVELVEEIGRVARGAKVIREGGKYYEVNPDGSRKEIPAPNDAIPEGGSLLGFLGYLGEQAFGTESPLDLYRANRDAKKEADRQAHNARIRRERAAAGADPNTGAYPIQRGPMND